jgi:hypothetical protein
MTACVQPQLGILAARCAGGLDMQITFVLILRSALFARVSKDGNEGARGHPSRRGQAAAPQDEGGAWSSAAEWQRLNHRPERPADFAGLACARTSFRKMAKPARYGHILYQNTRFLCKN